jgi:inner membrane protein
MSPITHLLASWSLAEASGLDGRDRAVITWAGVAPDLDGLGAIPDVISRALGMSDPALYGRIHHVLLHGLFGALLLPVCALALAHRRLRTFLWCVAAIHLHLLGDLVGSRGPAPEDLWPIHYLGPLSESWTLEWAGQWPLNAWPNILFTLGLLAFVFVRAATVGHSPVQLFSERAHTAFVATIQARWRRLRRAA